MGKFFILFGLGILYLLRPKRRIVRRERRAPRSYRVNPRVGRRPLRPYNITAPSPKENDFRKGRLNKPTKKSVPKQEPNETRANEKSSSKGYLGGKSRGGGSGRK